jgi:hypothetical protein
MILSNATLHVGDELVYEVVTSNPTDRMIHISTVRTHLEVVNSEGKDIGTEVIAGPEKSREASDPYILSSMHLAIRPHGQDDFTFHFKQHVGTLPPGTYRCRVGETDSRSRQTVYSNVVVLTVIP